MSRFVFRRIDAADDAWLLRLQLMTLSDPHAYLLAGFTEHDVEEILDDLDYLLQNAAWPYSKDRTATMLVESPHILREFLDKVRRDALRSAMISKAVKNRVLG